MFLGKCCVSFQPKTVKRSVLSLIILCMVVSMGVIIFGTESLMSLTLKTLTLEGDSLDGNTENAALRVKLKQNKLVPTLESRKSLAVNKLYTMNNIQTKILQTTPEEKQTEESSSKSNTMGKSTSLRKIIVTTNANNGRRLGNQIFSYASLLGIAAQNDMEPVIPGQLNLLRVFKTKMNSSLDINKNYGPFHYFKPPKIECISKSGIVSLPRSGRSVMLTGFWHNWHYFENVSERLREHLQFRDHIDQAAEVSLKNIVPTARTNSSYILVGMHVRRGDMVTVAKTDPIYTVAPPSYFANAMKYFRDKYKRLRFLVVSDDLIWCKENIAGSDVVFAKPDAPHVHLAMLSKCDHVIFSVGTYGWWAAWLANGTTIYFKNTKADTNKTSKPEPCYAQERHGLQNWIGME